jgi:acyl carrier protein
MSDVSDPLARTPAWQRAIRVHDHFLEPGGDSLLAIQIISRVIRTFQVELPVRALFESPTAADMALMIVQNQAVKTGQENVERMLAELEALSREEARKREAGDGL